MNQVDESRVKEDALSSIIERLRREKAQEKNECKEQGRRAGREWALRASYSSLQYAAEVFINPSIYHHDGNEALAVAKDDEILGVYFRRALAELIPRLPGCGDLSVTKSSNSHIASWFDGWFEAVQAFWWAVCTKL